MNKKIFFLCVTVCVSSIISAKTWQKIAKDNDIAEAQEQIDKGVDVNIRLKDGMTPLLWATFYASSDVVRFLVEHGSQLNDRNNIRYQDGYWVRKGWDAIDIAMTNEKMGVYGYAPILKKDFSRRVIVQLLSKEKEEFAQRAIDVLDFRDSLDEVTYKLLKFFTRVSFATFPTVCNTYELTLDCIEKNISGDFVECGVARGAQVAAIGYACQTNGCEKKIHLFDSFQGIPLAGPNDASQPGIRGPIKHDVNVPLDTLLVSSGVDVFSVEYVKNNMKNWRIQPDHLVYHEGWFQNTIPADKDSIEKICLLRLDGDLYESTIVCLEHFYSKISSGGYLIIDDYALAGCRKAVDEYREQNGIACPIIEIPNGRGPAYWQVK